MLFYAKEIGRSLFFFGLHAKCLHVFYKIYQNNTFCNEKSDVIFERFYLRKEK